MTLIRNITWRCDVCNAEKSDNKIDVVSKKHELCGGGSIAINIKYCNDNQNCKDKADSVANDQLNHMVRSFDRER